MASSLRTELPQPYSAPDTRARAAFVSDAPTRLAATTIIRSRRDEPTGRWAGFAIVIAVHLVALYALLQYEPARQALTAMAPIMVDLITPPKLEEPPPPPPPPPRPQPKPRIEPLKTAEPPPIIAAPPTAAPAEFVAPPPAPPAPPVEVAASAAPAITAPTAAPVPITPPSFDAAYLKNEPPRYPNVSRRMSETGRVLLRVLVSAAGTPEKVELATTSGFERLDASALETVRTWKFVPAHQAGKPVAAWVQVPITFSLAR